AGCERGSARGLGQHPGRSACGAARARAPTTSRCAACALGSPPAAVSLDRTNHHPKPHITQITTAKLLVLAWSASGSFRGLSSTLNTCPLSFPKTSGEGSAGSCLIALATLDAANRES